ncbi:MAG: septation protein SepH [Buchananella hordeovulneris]|nr:septation protein SepH [Buchananella hordeovulneris]
MIELELLGLDSTGDHLVLVNSEGERFTLAIDDSLRATVRRSRPSIPVPQNQKLRPKEIQSLLRAGATLAEVAEASGMAEEMVEKFAAPVRGEQAWAVERAQSCRVGHDPDAPSLGDLVIDRLAARGVDPASLQWDAIRRGTEPWEVFVTFVQAAEEREARWSVDLATGSVRGLNDQARWLTETSTPGPLPPLVRTGSPTPGTPAPGVTPLPGVTPRPGTAPVTGGVSADLLDGLNAARGVRGASAVTRPAATPTPAPVVSLRRAEASEPAAVVDDVAAHRPAPAPAPREESAPEKAELPLQPEPTEQEVTEAAASAAPAEVEDDLADSLFATPAQEQPTLEGEVVAEPEKPKRSARRSMPTWDEIVFGSKK